jgi:glucosamine 6-phosphate synthetase-like amidotransferase/phosphosugar isomerase protein
MGSDEDGEFIVVSSDLTSVLAKTRFLIPLVEGQGIYFTASDYFVFSLHDGQRCRPGLKRSKLNIADIALQPKYHFFMEQEIDATVANLDTILKYYFPQPGEDFYFPVFERHARACKDIVFELLKLYSIFDRARLGEAFRRIVGSPGFTAIADELRSLPCGQRPQAAPAIFVSDEAQLLRELREFGAEHDSALLVLDWIVIWKKKRKVMRFKDEAVELFRRSFERGGRVFFIGAGTSYHAALSAGYFFNNLTSLGIVPCNPDLFRSVYMNSLRPDDVLLAITQSGETKDLVDILNQVRERFRQQVRIVAVVNNENSTIPQEKADFFLPLLCGPEIAVAATKSFSAQLALFYLLAGSVRPDGPPPLANLEKVRHLVGHTLKACEEDVTAVMLRFFLKPSIHVLGTSLIGLAREGALKIREVVLNHAEGYDAAEFKHGPNTILGKNTLFSFADMESLLADMAEFCRDLPAGHGEAAASLCNWIRDFKFADFSAELANGRDPDGARELYARFRRRVSAEKYFSNYPLIFVCPPDERDMRITISQIHTHKIRGADVVLIAEENAELAKALEGKPAGLEDYFCRYIKVPGSGDVNQFVFQAAVVLQRLALKMSVAKMKYLNRARIENHGVHPDVPKNVSKSITVD